jgi:hypothetical protein
MGRTAPFGARKTTNPGQNKNKNGGKKKAAAVPQPTAMRTEHRELKNLRTAGSFLALSPFYY